MHELISAGSVAKIELFASRFFFFSRTEPGKRRGTQFRCTVNQIVRKVVLLSGHAILTERDLF